MNYDPPTGTADFFAKLRKEQFTAFIDENNRPVIRDQLGRAGRKPSKALIDYAKTNRNAIHASLMGWQCWPDGDDDRCAECSAFVFPESIAGGIVATCYAKERCPFWHAATEDELFPLPEMGTEERRPGIRIYSSEDSA